MARAEVASASVNSDSIKGLAQSIAKPAYRRLLTAEPALRRAVPALIIAFLLTICVGAIVQVLDHRRQAIGDIVKQIEGSADFLVDGIERMERSKSEKSGFERRLQAELQRLMPAWARAPGRQVLVANGDGIIVAGIRHELIANGDNTISSNSGNWLRSSLMAARTCCVNSGNCAGSRSRWLVTPTTSAVAGECMSRGVGMGLVSQSRCRSC